MPPTCFIVITVSHNILKKKKKLCCFPWGGRCRKVHLDISTPAHWLQQVSRWSCCPQVKVLRRLSDRRRSLRTRRSARCRWNTPKLSFKHLQCTHRRTHARTSEWITTIRLTDECSCASFTDGRSSCVEVEDTSSDAFWPSGACSQSLTFVFIYAEVLLTASWHPRCHYLLSFLCTVHKPPVWPGRPTTLEEMILTQFSALLQLQTLTWLLPLFSQHSY